MELNVMELNGTGATRSLSVSDKVFGSRFRQHLVHQVVVAHRAAGRAGTKAQLSRGELSGTTRKFKEQKGGGARHGDYRAPIFVGGGVTFAAKPRDHKQKVNRKAYRAAICSILAELNRQDRLRLVNGLGVDAPKTKGMLAKLAELNVSGRVLLVCEQADEALYLASRNIPYVQVLDVMALNPVSLVGADYVVLNIAAVEKLEGWLA